MNLESFNILDSKGGISNDVLIPYGAIRYLIGDSWRYRIAKTGASLSTLICDENNFKLEKIKLIEKLCLRLGTDKLVIVYFFKYFYYGKKNVYVGFSFSELYEAGNDWDIWNLKLYYRKVNMEYCISKGVNDVLFNEIGKKYGVEELAKIGYKLGYTHISNCFHWKRARLIWIGHLKEVDNIWNMVPMEVVVMILNMFYEDCGVYRVV